ncbi:MAG: hypothetical protein IPL79_12055 [Myxococcales bacterium]|nr:hypothetical protein [Myxococcales bacterium]
MWNALAPGQQRFIKFWVGGIVAIYVAIIVVALFVISNEKQQSKRNHALRMDPAKAEPGQTAPDPLPATGNFVTVHTGMYVENIETFSIRDLNWSANFYVWFRWQGSPELNPAGTMQLVDATIDKRELVESYAGPDGTNYQRVRITARMFKHFNTTRVPLDDHLMTIGMEDSVHDASQLRYVADTASNISSRAKIPGYDVTGFETVVKGHTYKTSYGDPRFTNSSRKTFTKFVVGISVKRASMGLYFKLLLGLFAGILLTFASFFVRPSEGSRFSFPTAAYFGAVANSYLTGQLLPPSGTFGLIDYVQGLGLFTISICLAASLYSGIIYNIRKDETFSKMLDRATRATILIVYVAANIALPFAAFSR